MFTYARIRLTLLYLLIIALISLSFSAVIYNDFSAEFESRLVSSETRLRGLSIPRQIALALLRDELYSAKRAVILRLALLNGAILLISGVGGYFLAGKTLSPIEEMVDDQKRFVADASHELRTPLTSLKTEIEVALRAKKLTNKEIRNLMKSNLDEIDKMKDLSNYLLSLSRYEAGSSEFKNEKVDLSEVVKSAIINSEKHAKVSGVKIIKKIRKVVINGDKKGLVELVGILLNNAIKYTPKGGKVRIETSRTRRHARLIVEDTGRGIQSADLPHIFERFYRADHSRGKDNIEGFGLGLSIAKSIADLHRATIGVKSKVGMGTVILVSFPYYF